MECDDMLEVDDFTKKKNYVLIFNKDKTNIKDKNYKLLDKI